MVAGSHHVGAMAVVTTIGRDAGTTGPMVLLARHAFKADRWGVLGGWVQRREDPAAACVREVLEETGLGVRVEDILGCEVHAINGKPLRYGGLTVAYRCSPRDPSAFRPTRRSAELTDVRWFSAEQAANLVTAFERSMITRAVDAMRRDQLVRERPAGA